MKIKQPKSGMGPGGNCICPKCGEKFPHKGGTPCLEERCPKCDCALVREGSKHHQMIEEKRQDR